MSFLLPGQSRLPCVKHMRPAHRSGLKQSGLLGGGWSAQRSSCFMTCPMLRNIFRPCI